MHKDIVEYYNRDNCQTIMHVGSNYINKIMKRLQVLVWRASKNEATKSSSPCQE